MTSHESSNMSVDYEALPAPYIVAAIAGEVAVHEWVEIDWSHLEKPDSYFRIVNQVGYDDLESTGVARSSPTGTDSKRPSDWDGTGVDLGHRPTSFPAFAKDKVDRSYLSPEGHSYVLEHPGPMYKRGQENPATKNPITGRHWAYRKFDSEGKVVTEIPSDEFSGVYRVSEDGKVHKRVKISSGSPE
jgi:hypothetical protein